MSFPNVDKTRTVLEQIRSLERIREEYQRTSGAGLSDDIMTSTWLPVLLKHFQEHLHLQMTSTSDYASIRQMVLSYSSFLNIFHRKNPCRVGCCHQLCNTNR